MRSLVIVGFNLWPISASMGHPCSALRNPLHFASSLLREGYSRQCLSSSSANSSEYLPSIWRVKIPSQVFLSVTSRHMTHLADPQCYFIETLRGFRAASFRNGNTVYRESSPYEERNYPNHMNIYIYSRYCLVCDTISLSPPGNLLSSFHKFSIHLDSIDIQHHGPAIDADPQSNHRGTNHSQASRANTVQPR